MIAAWMLYAVAVAGLAALGALALERLFRPHRIPVRWAWAVALALGSTLPVARPFLDDRGPLAAGAAEAYSSVPVVVLDALTVTVGEGSLLHGLDPVLVGLWAALSLGVLGLGLRALLRLRRLGRRWTPRRLHRTPVLVADEVGPAVVGLLEHRIVLPRWLTEEGEAVRLELVLQHEREHLAARDPTLLAGAFLVLALFPWNPALWWAVHRLREAVEMDCDARVLRRSPARLRAYAETLLDVSGHGPLAGAVAALAEPRSFLERRIRTMTSDPPKRVVVRTLALGAVALLAVSGACLAPEPGSEERDGSPVEVRETGQDPGVLAASDIADEPVHTPYTVAPDIRNRGEIVQALQDAYPPLLEEAAVEGKAVIWFLVDRAGSVREVELRESAGHEALDRAALEVARVFEFTPARNGEEEVPVWIALPISFVTG